MSEAIVTLKKVALTQKGEVTVVFDNETQITV